MKAMRYLIGALSVSLVVLSVLAYAPFAHSHAAGAAWHATWLFHPNSLGEAKAKATDIVIARVTNIQQTPDIVVAVTGEPNGEDRIPTQQITVEVVKSLKGRATGTLTIFRTGDQIKGVEGDPAYTVGDSYVLFVQPKEDQAGVYRIISPEGRFRVVNNKLEPMAHEGYATEFRGKSLAALERAVAAAK